MNIRWLWCYIRSYHKGWPDLDRSIVGNDFLKQVCWCGAEQRTVYEPGRTMQFKYHWTDYSLEGKVSRRIGDFFHSIWHWRLRHMVTCVRCNEIDSRRRS